MYNQLQNAGVNPALSVCWNQADSIDAVQQRSQFLPATPPPEFIMRLSCQAAVWCARVCLAEAQLAAHVAESAKQREQEEKDRQAWLQEVDKMNAELNKTTNANGRANSASSPRGVGRVSLWAVCGLATALLLWC